MSEKVDEIEMNDENMDDSSSEESDEVGDDEDVVNADNSEKEGTQSAYLPDKGLEDGEELVMDEQAYILYHQASLGPPCLSFDVIPDDLGHDRGYPMSLYGVAGTQASKTLANSIIVFKMENLHPIKRRAPKNDEDDEDDDDEDEDENDPEKQPRLRVSAIKHSGCVNRMRFKTLGDTSVVAAWSETGTVSVWSLDKSIQNVNMSGVSSDNRKDNPRESASPLFTFKGHPTEGFALNWSPTTQGVLASGDCAKNIHVWRPAADGTWNVDDSPLVGHKASVEDVLWSPNEASVLASCSVDKSIRIWDVRAKPQKANMLTVENAHSADVNVIDWNPNEPFVASGGDDGSLKVWDLRSLETNRPVVVFRHHKAPITSVEWHPTDFTVLASSGEDNQIALWDLAIEKDAEAESTPDVEQVPPQLLFIHQGMEDVKELHWHPQVAGLMMSTSQTGLDVFRTISV